MGRREAPSAPPLGELLSEREAEGVRYEIWVRCKIRTTPSQSARSGCQLSQRESQGRFAPGRVRLGGVLAKIRGVRADSIRPYKGVPQIAARQQHFPVKTNNYFFSFFPIL